MYRLLVSFYVAWLLSASAFADEVDEQARVQFDQGIKMYEEGDFEGASIAFNRAYELRPSYKILYNVGQVEAELKHYARAFEAYSQYLTEGGDDLEATRKDEVSAKLVELEALVGQVTIEYSRDGVTVLIDEERRATTPLDKPLLVDMGSHELSLRQGIKEIYRESFRVAGGQKLTLALEAPEETAAPVASETAPEAPPATTASEAQAPEAASAAPTDAPKKKKRKWTYVAFGIGAAAGIAGGILGGISMAKEKSIEADCDGNRCLSSRSGDADKVKTLAVAADALYGVAGAAGIAALVLFFVEPKQSENKAVSVIPSVAPSHLGLAVEGRF